MPINCLKPLADRVMGLSRACRSARLVALACFSFGATLKSAVLSTSPLVVHFHAIAQQVEQKQLLRFASSLSPSSTFGSDACTAENQTGACIGNKELIRKSDIYWLSPEENTQ